MQILRISHITLNPTPSGNTICTLWYHTPSDPAPIILSNNVSVPPSGNLLPPLDFTVPDGDIYVDAVPNCGGTPYEELIPATTTTTAATTTTTTTAGTTTTTTAGTTTTTTTGAGFDTLQIVKDVGGDRVTVTVNGVDYVSPAGEVGGHEWPGVLPHSGTYNIDVVIITSGRPNAPIDISDNTGSLAFCSGCLSRTASHDGVNGNVNVTVGA